MKKGDQVVILGQAHLSLGDDDLGTIDRFEFGRVVVRFGDGSTSYYKPEEIRVVEAPAQAGGAAG